jgi:quercetin dioxygenase-like cupin family protein
LNAGSQAIGEDQARPGIRTQLLVVNTTPGERTVIATVEPGVQSEAHHHSLDEHIMVLKGSYHDGSRLMRRGDYSFRRAGESHASSTVAGCVLLLIYTAAGTTPAIVVPKESGLS